MIEYSTAERAVQGRGAATFELTEFLLNLVVKPQKLAEVEFKLAAIISPHHYNRKLGRFFAA